MTVESVVRLFACISFVLGGIECFAGLKLMKPMIIIWSFFCGSMLGIVGGVSSGHIMVGIIFAIVLGLCFAVLAIIKRKAAICVVIAFMAATTVYMFLGKLYLAILAGIPFGVLAFFYKKVTSFIVTSASGAGIILISAYTMFGLPLNEDVAVTAVLWVPLALAGMGCQYITTHMPVTQKKQTHIKKSESSVKNKGVKYPGMQKAYRNYCIKCGAGMMVGSDICPKCGFNFDD